MDRKELERVDPQFWIVGGPNGAGKTTLARDLLKGLGLPPTTSILNPDSITKAIGQVTPRLTRCLTCVPHYGRRAMDYAGVVSVEAVVSSSIESNHDVCVETVLSTDKYLKHVSVARSRGFHTGLIFVGLPHADAHVARVRARVDSGGHDVPEDKIRSRWEGAHRQLVTFAKNVDHLLIFANEVFGEPQLVVERIDGGFTVFERERLPRVTIALDTLD